VARIAKTDWGPAVELASNYFPEIICKVEDDPLWNGKRLRVSTPMNLLHEVAHYQIAPKWRRHKEGYGLGMEPEGRFERYTPILVSELRAVYEETLASILGILWCHELGYDWLYTAEDHSWLPITHDVETIEHFVDLPNVAVKIETLIHIGVVLEDLTPILRIARPWRVPARWKRGLIKGARELDERLDQISEKGTDLAHKVHLAG